MKVSDYIVKFFEEKGIYDFFGYQGTMIAHFVDSIGKNNKCINHSVYNEQAAAFAACGYAKATGKCAIAYSTSGPGALNLVSGIADAYYDSVPVIFITGQINTNEYLNIKDLRQQAFQETNVTEIVKKICKYSVFISDAAQIEQELEKAWTIANSGRKGPVVLDIPMNIQRLEMEVVGVRKEERKLDQIVDAQECIGYIKEKLQSCQRPLFILGNGISKTENMRKEVKKLINKIKIPTISTLLGSDFLQRDNKYYFGVLGAAYGHRCANIIACEKADLIVCFGASLCRRQTGNNTSLFAPNAEIVRIDIDEYEILRKVHEDEKSFLEDVNNIICEMNLQNWDYNFENWTQICLEIEDELTRYDELCLEREPNKIIKTISKFIEDDAIITCDVGQHMMWVMQSYEVKNNRILYSGGHGAMGFALPAAVGAYYGCNKEKTIICISGDGSFQMNIQELQMVVREKIPMVIIVLNNNSLGLIRQQQDDFFNSNYYGATQKWGFSSPNFTKIGEAYGIESYRVYSVNELSKYMTAKTNRPILLEMMLPIDTKAVPKTYFGQHMTNQRPYIPQRIKEKICKL